MTETGEYDPSEMAQRIAEAQAGARYFADMAQSLQSSLTWDTERAGDLYPVMMDALNGIEDTREACEEAAKALEDMADALKREMYAYGGRVQINVKIPQELYDEMEKLKIVRKLAEKEDLTTTDLVTELLTGYMGRHQDEIREMEERMGQRIGEPREQRETTENDER